MLSTLSLLPTLIKQLMPTFRPAALAFFRANSRRSEQLAETLALIALLKLVKEKVYSTQCMASHYIAQADRDPITHSLTEDVSTCEHIEPLHRLSRASHNVW